MEFKDPIQHPVKENKILNALVWFVSIFNPILQIPQVYKVYMAKEAGNISAITWNMMMFSSLVWIWYGITHKSKPIIYGNIVFVIVCILMDIAIIFWG